MTNRAIAHARLRNSRWALAQRLPSDASATIESVGAAPSSASQVSSSAA